MKTGGGRNECQVESALYIMLACVCTHIGTQGFRSARAHMHARQLRSYDAKFKLKGKPPLCQIWPCIMLVIVLSSAPTTNAFIYS